MITHLLRLSLAHRLKPFLFKAVDPHADAARKPDTFLSKSFGLYIHVPFCEKICDFCPYNKELYSPDKMKRFISALKIEIEQQLKRTGTDNRLDSIYFGGGSPALASEHIPELLKLIEQRCGKVERIGIELHPRDVSPETLERLKQAGVNMISIGAQSFNECSLEQIGREAYNIEDCFALVKERAFDVIDVDLIFALPGQTVETLKDDFERAVNLGGTQISTYPFIRFSFAGKRYPKPSRRNQRKLLSLLAGLSDRIGYERTSVWTFAKKGSGRYSSVTRNNVLGLGPSATSLFSSRFTINTFSVDEYCRSLETGYSPCALELRFNSRVRRMYWLFWSCYNLHVSQRQFRELFQDDLEHEFGGVFKAASFLKLIKQEDDGYRLTEKGAILFHRVEQIYTHQYIDKTWRICSANPWPKRIGLF